MASINDIKNLIKGMKAQPVPVNEGNAAIKQAVVAPQVVEEPKPQLQLVKPNNQTAAVRPETAYEASNADEPTVITCSSIKAATKHLIEGVDYGQVRGIQGNLLFKQGALKILKICNCKYHTTMLDKTTDIPNSFIGYTVKVSITNQDGEIISEAICSANSKEKKFADKGFSSDCMLINMATKRALVSSVKNLLV